MSEELTRRDALRGLGVGASGLALGMTATTASAKARYCPLTKVFWKNHPNEWDDDDGNPIERMWVAGESYPSRARFAEDGEVTVMDILTEPSRDDKSIIMAQQRIAAQLNYRASIKCDESNEAYARATVWLWALDDPLVDEDGNIGANQRTWDVEVTEEMDRHVKTGAIDHVVEPGTYGEAVKDELEEYNTGDLCTCSIGG